MLTYKIVGLRKLQLATKQAPGVFFNRQVEAMHRSVDLVEGVARLATRTGPGHFGFHMVDRYWTLVRPGPRRMVGVIANSSVQARFGEFGTKPHEIHAKHGALKLGDGHYAMVVQHPGVKARHLMRKSLAASKGAIKVFFVDAANGVAQSMATSGD